ncbi:MAG: hypothetical protein Q9218_004644 [Villophora microphyllina]
MSWFWRGFQSAVFYYVSCAPCTQRAYRRKRRKDIARSKAARDMEDGLYPHPAPFSTNQYWQEEMALGPGPPRKKKDMDRKRGRDSAQMSQRDLTTGNSARTGTSSADTIIAKISTEESVEVEQERRSGDGWNRRRYQREDEDLWGADSVYDPQPGDKNYYVAKNPAVNDLHPPVVSTQPTHRSETRWMLQPPPSARVMEGKERANRSRSGSGGSNSSSKREVGLDRQLGERIMEEKRRKGQTPEPQPEMSRVTSTESRTSNGTARGQRHDRDHPPQTSKDAGSSTESLSTSRSKKPVLPPLISIPTDDPYTPGVSPTHQSPISQKPPTQTFTGKLAAQHPCPPHQPQLSTIVSSTNNPKAHLSPTATSPSRSTQAQNHLLRPPLVPSQSRSTSSLRALQELTSPSNALNMPRPSSEGAPTETHVDLPNPDENETRELVELPSVESFWPPPSIEAGRGVGGKRAERWSMDL